MKVLVALPTSHPEFACVDNVINGTFPSSGTTGSIIRLALFLAKSGVDVYLSGASETQSQHFPCGTHKSIDESQFDRLIVHQSHWDGNSLSFGNNALKKTFIWYQNATTWEFANSFLQSGGSRIVVPSIDCANLYRAIPQWRQKVMVIYNSYCPVFVPSLEQKENFRKRLLFVGSITPTKGFIELMQVWSYLAKQQVELELAIAGSISIHKDSRTKLGSMGIAEYEFEANSIQPWLRSLPECYQPTFLGALSPLQLRSEIVSSWAVIVNPSWFQTETFCVSAVEAQACDRPVFSVAAGALKETVYQGSLKTLARSRTESALGDLIINALANPSKFKQHGKLAGEFVRSKFNYELIRENWLKALIYQPFYPQIPCEWNTPRNVIYDLMRWSRTGIFVKRIYSVFR